MVTINDIAKELNISPSTVSRALHDSHAISEQTKHKVNCIARERNYQPNMLALSLLNKKTLVIGVIVPEITSYFFSTVIDGIQDMVSPFGYKLMIGQTGESYENEYKLIKEMSLVRVDGILVSPSSHTVEFKHFDLLKKANIPLVIFDRDCPSYKDAHKVVVNSYDGALQAVNYLIQNGCKRIAHITGPSNLSISSQRLQGYLDALKMNNVPIDEELIIICNGFSPECGIDATQELLNLSALPDAIFAVNDAVAIGAMHVIKEHGYHIPKDISVVGFDDEPYSCYFTPSLTSVWQPVYDLGMLSSKILLNHMNNNKKDNDNDAYRYEVLKTELVLRESSINFHPAVVR